MINKVANLEIYYYKIFRGLSFVFSMNKIC